MQRTIVLYLLQVGHSVATASPSRQAGGICDGVNVSQPASEYLRGKHLVIGIQDWAPYATPDPTSPKGWTGMDVTLLERMSTILSFTYELHDTGFPLEEETWT